jgi:hypothetical protein
MKTGQPYKHKAAFCLRLSGSQTWDNVRQWKAQVNEVANVTFSVKKADTYVEYLATGRWK